MHERGLIAVAATADLSALPLAAAADILVRDDDGRAPWTVVPERFGPSRQPELRVSVLWRRSRSIDDLRRQIACSGLGRVDAVVLAEPVRYEASSGQAPWAALLAAWREVEHLHHDGLVGEIGIWDGGQRTLEALRSATRIQPASTFVEFHPYLQNPELLEYCRAHGIAVFSYDPLASAEQLRRHGVVPPEADPVVLAIAAERGAVPVAVCLGWCLAKGVIPFLPKVAGPPPAHLLPADVARMDALHRDCRVHLSHATLACLYGNFSTQLIQVLDPERRDPGEDYLKVLYAQLTPWEGINRLVSRLIWRFVFNLPDTLRHYGDLLRGRSRETPLIHRLLGEIGKAGYARTNLTELGLAPLLEQLQTGAEQFEYWALSAKAAGQYPLRVDDPRLAVLESGVLKEVADRYTGTQLVPRKSYTMVNTPVDFPASAQRLWHTDVEDYYVLKVYVLLTPIDDFSGALDYVDATHPKGRFATLAAQLMKHTFRKARTWIYDYQVPDDLLYRAIRPDAVTRIGGKTGDVLIFDARGIHRGGHTLSRTRRVGVLTFTGRNTIHGTFPPTTRWGRICHRLAWKTNVRDQRGAIA